jgi:hypothetical protein
MVEAIAFASLVAADAALALDRPVDAARLVIRRTPVRASLVFVSRDPGFLFPAPGGGDDPTIGGLVVELFSATEGAATLAAPAGLGKPGWSVTLAPTPGFRFQNPLAPAGTSPLRAVVLKQGRVLKVTGRAAGLPLAAAQGAVGIRVVTGARRSCALFGPATIKRDEPGRFVARNAPAAALPDYSDTSLGAPPPPSTTTTTTLPGCAIVPDPFEPKCGGACPPGEQCVGGFGPALEPECACIPDDAVACLGSGYPACGGACGAGRVCQAFHLLPGELIELRSCACVDPADTCADPPGTCFAIGVCPPGEACTGQGAPTSACGCAPP